MGLDVFPKQCPCGGHKYQANTPDEGSTHPVNAPCPFANDDFQVAMLGRCCWLRGTIATRELEALGKPALSDAMHNGMTAERALAFARKLRGTADSLEERHRNDATKPEGARWNGTWDGKAWDSCSTFEQALASIREAARWYEKVGQLGFGVHAWI